MIVVVIMKVKLPEGNSHQYPHILCTRSLFSFRGISTNITYHMLNYQGVIPMNITIFCWLNQVKSLFHTISYRVLINPKPQTLMCLHGLLILHLITGYPVWYTIYHQVPVVKGVNKPL